ncbi:MAG: DUF1801 domain-containing protein [Acidobacteriia bacterium]|nr:DUF1801 domain-containing protein [Terriglobia bacterium]
MKRANARDRASAAKDNLAPKTVDEYLAAVPEPARSTLTRIRAVIRSVVPPGTTETISYQIPMFKYKGALFGYAAFSNHCSLFPMGSSVIQVFKKELQGFSLSKGTIRFPVDKPPSASLLKKLVKARIAQNEQKKQR